MQQERRHRVILEMINNQDFLSVHEIVTKCNASEITARRDLALLESKNLIIRTHGGAVKSKATDNLFNYNLKINENAEQKISICRKASEFICNNDIIFIDCGTTLIHLTKFITRFDSLTVITNSLPVVSELINFSKIKLIIIGGEAIGERKAIYGTVAERSIGQYHADKAFIGATGVSVLKGLTSSDENESAITLKMAENADQVFLLCDSSKIERNSFVQFAPLSKINYLITDEGIEESLINAYKEHNVSIIKAP
jgi:DeoR family transcriptional regulator, fructose operon transcriptional repressor